MPHENIAAERQTNEPEKPSKIVPTEVSFRSGGGLAIESDGSMSFIRDSGDRFAFLPERRVASYDIAASLEPSNHELHIHGRMSGVLHIDSDGKLTSVIGPCVLPFVPAETVATFLGTIELDDGSVLTFDHKGRIFGLPDSQDPGLDICAAAVPWDTARRRMIDVTELCRRVTIAQVLEVIGWKPIARNGPTLRGACPVHKSTSERNGSFSVNLERNTFQCAKPGCSDGNQLDLFAAATGFPVFEAALDLCEKTGTQIPWID